MKIAVVGVGALGSLLGAYLGEIGDVVMVGHWREQVDTLQANGLLMIRPDGTQTRFEPRIVDDPRQVDPVDVALVVVKSRQTEVAAQTTAELLKEDGLAITLQNGLNNYEKLRDVLGEQRVTLGVTAEGAMMIDVAQVRHAGRGPTHFGRNSLLGDAQLVKLPQVVDLFSQAGFEAYLVDDTDALVWGKLAVNAAINPLTALLRVPNGFLVEHEALVNIMRRAAGEVADVAEALGIDLPFPDAAARAIEVAQATAGNRSSMLQDVTRGAPTEVEAICGAVAKIARDLGVYTPVNVRLCRLVSQIEGRKLPLLEQGDVAGLLDLLDLDSIKNRL
ncbi:MAG TPA: 2-dehydropantoate 2-reductase [Promineifilum sp.]